MHLFYIHEAACNGDSAHISPVFAAGGIVLRGVAWDKTHTMYQALLSAYFDGEIPAGFTLHPHELLSADGSGYFFQHDKERRHTLLKDLVDLISLRKHYFYYFAIDRKSLAEYDVSNIEGHSYFDLKEPYLLACDHLITAYECYTKEKLDVSERAIVFIDEKQPLVYQIEAITYHRRFEGPAAKRIKSIAEFSYPVNPERNTMLQLSDLLLCITGKYLEIENGYGNDYTTGEKQILHGLYEMIDDRLIFKRMPAETGRYAEQYNKFITAVSCRPAIKWKTRVF